jgi:NADH-quinone oxidoreductase subunit M
MLWMFQRVFFEKTNDRTMEFKDLSASETLTFIPVILLIIAMGVFPQAFIKKIEPAAQLQVAKIFAMTQSQVAETTVPTPGHNNHKN